MTGVDLSAQAMFNVKPGENEYINVGAAISEVGINVAPVPILMHVQQQV